MHVTVILKDFTEVFYDGGHGITGLLALSDADKFAKLKAMSAERRVSMKIERGAFRDAVELNQILRGDKGAPRFSFKLEPRKGYKLATFEITN